MRILLAEDDELLGDGVATALKRAGHAVDWVHDGRQAIQALSDESFDLVLLDLGLPRVDGLAVLSHVRGQGNAVPILIMTARDSINDRVRGLDMGADDYLVKPVDQEELMARIRALARRDAGRTNNEIQVGRLWLDPIHFDARFDGQIINLSVREFAILQHLAENAGKPVRKQALEQRVYGWDEQGSRNAIEVHVHNLRKKLGGELIRTLRGVGYQLEDSGA